MKLKINKNTATDIEFVRRLIAFNRDREQALIDGISSRMNLRTEKEKDTLWDYIYNNSDWMVELEE